MARPPTVRPDARADASVRASVRTVVRSNRASRLVRLARGVTLVAAVLAPAVPGAAQPAGPAPGWHRVELPASASYAWWYLPAAVAAGSPVPVVVFLHGSGATPEGWRPFLGGPAEDAGVVVIAPAASDPLGWGIADDTVTIDEAVDRVRGALGTTFPLDPARIGLAGHSSGGAYAYFLTYETVGHYCGVASFSAPFRHILGVADPRYTAPLLLWYGTADPNYLGGHFAAIRAMMDHRGIPWQSTIVSGAGHSDIGRQDLADAFRFLAAQRYPVGITLLPKRLGPR